MASSWLWMLAIDIVGSKMRTFEPKSGAGPGGFEPPPHSGVVVQLGAQAMPADEASAPASGKRTPPPSGDVEASGVVAASAPPSHAPSSSDPPSPTVHPVPVAPLDAQAASVVVHNVSASRT